MQINFGVPWKDTTLHLACPHGSMARWAIQTMHRYILTQNNIVGGGICLKLHPTTAKWDTMSILSFRTSEHNDPYHIQAWDR